MNFNEGAVYKLDELPDSDMTHSGKLELIGDNTLGAQYENYYVTFEWHTVRCTDVTHKSEISETIK